MNSVYLIIEEMGEEINVSPERFRCRMPPRRGRKMPDRQCRIPIATGGSPSLKTLPGRGRSRAAYKNHQSFHILRLDNE